MKQFEDIYSQTFPKLKVSKSGNQKSDILQSILRTSDGSLERWDFSSKLSSVHLYILLYCRKHRQNVRISCERDQSYEEEEEEEKGEEDDWQSYSRPTFKIQSESWAGPSLRKQSLVNNALLRHTKEARSYSQAISTLPPTTIWIILTKPAQL